MKRYQKILLSIALFLIITLGGAQIFVSFYLDEQLKETAINRFHEETDEDIGLQVGDLDIWILSRQLDISEIILTKNEEGPGTDIRATVDNISLSGIGFLNLLLNDNLNLDQLELVNPQIYVTSPGKKKDESPNRQWSDLSQQLSENILQNLNSISISDFSIRGLSLDFNRADLPLDPLFSFSDSNIRLHDIRIDSASIKEKQILPAKELSTTFREVRYQTTNDLYNLTADKIAFSSPDQSLNIYSVKLKPKYNKKEFSRQIPHEMDRIDMVLDQLNWEDLDIEQLNRGDGITSRYVIFKKANLDIYHDKHPPPPPEDYPPLPLDMLRNIPFPVSVDSISMTNSHIRYSERHEEAEEIGYVDFADLSATFKKVSNDEEKWKRGDYPTLHAEADVMDEARLKADFEFVPADTGDHQQITGNLGPMDMQEFNKALEPLAFIRVDDGQLLGLDFKMILGEERAGGQVIMRYEDFKISLLNKELSEDTIGKKVLSALANSFKIESENKGEDLRISKVDFERDKEKSTFNYWWKSLLSGLKASIGF